MTKLMLDTNVCVDVMRHRSPRLRRRLERTAPGDIAISSIVAAELWTGVAKSREPERAAAAVRDFLQYLRVLDWPGEAAASYGRIRAGLETSGRSIGAMDLLIAAHAVHEDAALLTRNRSEFDRVAGLKVETGGSR
ncbi:MAG: type II toxin-antitoxin system VapC family toxin [Burkholderiales bacterium]